MKIAIVAWGTTGDVYPVLALADRLLKNEHHVRVCAPTIYKEKINEIGADFYQVGVDFDLKEFQQTMDNLIPMYDPMKPLLLIAKEGVIRRGEKWYNDCLDGIKGYDIVVCHSIDIPAQEAAIRRDIPWLTVTYCPGFIKTPENAPYPFPNWSKTFNAFIWKMVRLRLRYAVDPLFNQFITSVGGKPRSTVALDEMYSPHLNFIAASPVLCPLVDLPTNHKYTGIWHLEQLDYIPSSDLSEFLADGPAPIVITFGSMGGTDSIETTKTLIDAIKMIKQRAIIQAGWGLLGTSKDDKDILCTEYVPHRWLFPKASCVVHHGGAGTTASVCLAKVPSVVVPHIGDQFYWGKRLYELGVSPKSLHRRNLNAKDLAKRIEHATKTASMKEKVETLGTQMALEDGLATAVNLLETFPLTTQ